MDLYPVLANEAASPQHAVWQQVIGEAVVEDEVVLEIAQLPAMGARSWRPSSLPTGTVAHHRLSLAQQRLTLLLTRVGSY